MEIIKELPDRRLHTVPIGGGDSVPVLPLAMLNPKIRVIGVEPAGANCMQESPPGQGSFLKRCQHHRGRHGGAVPRRSAVPRYPGECG